ncbi:MBL fold metallo-hydrolase [Occultella glacieicola]|uniref:MBL fold metallo-hydrolase n=1 Tax=Occultella glacieicola TaxID=2518684 RepID=A0ABY2E0X1_9MICO|nr:MBL fold metallo-hydrolase [Occultella glacieicola]TDE91599.1 MBL fold metallo-hydrolase [Occultella glacieicola]
MENERTAVKSDSPTTIGRRSVLAAAAATPLVGLAPSAWAGSRAHPQPGFARFEWLGTAGWRVRTPTTTLLVDPYLSRFDVGLAAGRFEKEAPLTLDEAAVDAVLGTAGSAAGAVDAVLVSHTHWDHFADVPHIAATRDSTVFTTLSGYHLAQSMGLPAGQVAVVKGGEQLRIGDVVVRVVRSLHSRSGGGGLLFPGTRVHVPEPPTTIADLPEGDTLGFVIRSPEGRGVLILGASDYDDQALSGLEVETVMVPVPSSDVTAGYAERLMSALARPRTVVLVHWDNFETPLSNPPRADSVTRERMDSLIADLRRHSPRTRVLTPQYLTPLDLL